MFTILCTFVYNGETLHTYTTWDLEDVLIYCRLNSAPGGIEQICKKITFYDKIMKLGTHLYHS